LVSLHNRHPGPRASVLSEDVVKFIAEVDSLLHSELHEEYCGIVYTASLEAPALIKIFELNHLGVSCGFSNKPLSGCVMRLIPPQPIESPRPLPATCQRWWLTLWT